jgi:transposase
MARNERSPSKLDALKKQGAVNPHPDRVRDPLFGADEFFDARDLVQVRYEMLRRVEVEGHAVTQACRAFGFSRPVFYKVRAALEREGLPGLVPKRRGPRGGHKLTAEVMKGIGEVLAEDRSLGAEAMVDLVEERYGVRVHVRSIQRALARRQKKKPQ